MFAAAAALAGAIFGYTVYTERTTVLSGGSWPGFGFGLAGSVIIVFCMLLSVRKALRTAPLGRATHWMQAHVWFGLISYPLIWLHAAFRLGGTLTTVLMIVFTVVWLSGIIGLWLQHRTPTRIVRHVPNATIHEQIGHVVDDLRRRAETIVAAAGARATVGVPELVGVGGGAGDNSQTPPAIADASPAGLTAFRQFYRDSVAPALTAKTPRLAHHGAAVSAAFIGARGRLPANFLAPLAELESLVRERINLDEQRRLHRLLQGWLLIHVPLSYAMFILSVIHAVMALKFRGIG